MQTPFQNVLPCPSRVLLLAVSAMWVLVPLERSAADDRAGAGIYRKLCASCHGPAGEGSDDYPKALVGTRSIAELARFIDKRMPEDAPETCVGDDARAVAQYIYDAFYSPLAQERIRPARIELSRLTVRQYRHAVADLVATFRGATRWDDQRGLRGEYFKSRRFNDKERVVDRIDPEIRFDFGESSPDPEQFEDNSFSIRWNGSLLAPDTGDYEFIVRTEHAARLWINDTKQPLIDAWVKSGDDTEYRASIHLLGGRVYPLRLEFSKAKQGVDDSKKQKEKPPAKKASLALEWKRPKRVDEVIAQRYLSPHRASELMVVAAPFPPDDRSIGYERGTSVSKEWDEATTQAAIEVAGYVADRLSELAGITDTAPPADAAASNSNGPAGVRWSSESDKRARVFCARLAERAFRRPLDSETRQFFIDRQLDDAPDLETAVKRCVLLVLKSPRFLYRELGSESLDDYDVASRLSFGLWDSLPDEELLKAAAAGALKSRDQVARHAERMINDNRTRAKVNEYLLQWLKVEHVPDLAKDPKRFPEFDVATASDLRTSLEMYLEDIVWNGRSDFRDLLLADSLYLNGRLAKLYGADLPGDAPFQRVELRPEERAGVLTHPYLMATFAYTETTSPIHRGVFIARSVLGRSLRPPPDAFTPLPPELHPELTTRERVALQTAPDACMKCHAMINPLGFTLENFDAIGRFRDKEKDRTIDASGSYLTRSGESVKFAGVRDLAAFLAASDETHGAFVEQLFQNLVKQPVRAYGPETLQQLQQSFAANDFNIRRLMAEIMATTALSR